MGHHWGRGVVSQQAAEDHQVMDTLELVIAFFALCQVGLLSGINLRLGTLIAKVENVENSHASLNDRVECIERKLCNDNRRIMS
jgi:hypothetical protein